MPELPTVVVAMSGGVDSSVAAALLVQQGYPVIGMMLRLWSEPDCDEDNRCCTPDALAQARRVASMLDIPFYAVDAREPFRQQVVQAFIDGYANGETPNPCLVCNRLIRWQFLLDRALAIGAQFMATGHYVRLRRDPLAGIQVLRSVDDKKDQSYVLHMLSQNQLAHSMFPLGEMIKPQVRQAAAEFGLPVAERPDSQDLCFLGAGDYRQFLRRNAPQVLHPGPILNQVGEQIGVHQGLAFYTIGQRKGLEIASPAPLYVISKDSAHNSLIVGDIEALGESTLTTRQVNWIAGRPPAQPLRALVKTRYTAAPVWAEVIPLENGGAQVRFDQPQRDITPGQAAVFYSAEVCLGGGIIERVNKR
jgi:tRNA-specific 2-thiouridylase